MTKPPLDLDPYSTKFSRHDFIQAQHFALLALRQFMNLDFRRTTQIVSEWSELRTPLELQKIPHWTTLEKAQKRLLKKGLSIESTVTSLTELAASV